MSDDHRSRLQRALGDAYQLGGLLGRGGFAEVYRARDLKLKRDVAVKTVRPDLGATPTLLNRFQREAEAMASLRHPNILPIYLVGEGEGLAYFLMPLVQGQSLAVVLEREGALPIAEASRILREAADALRHAHAAGMIHRDIKPDNVLLEGPERRVLVMDFGIAKVVEAEETQLTGTGMIVGTPHYMSPEQASGERALDHRSDIYSLGVLAFQMIAGRLPFTAPSVQGVIVKHLTEEPPRLTALRRDCPASLAAIVTRCLAKDPDARWESAETLVRALAAGEARGAGRSSGARRVAEEVRGTVGATPVALRWHLAAFVLGTGGLLAADLATGGTVEFAPIVAAVWGLALASHYGRVWMAGYSWRDVLAARGNAAIGLGDASTESVSGSKAAFGEYAPAVQRVRSERALVVGFVARMPRSERQVLPAVVPAADRLLARTRNVAVQLDRLDRTAVETRERLARSTGTAARDRQILDEAEQRRAALRQDLGACERAARELRAAVERAVALGARQVQGELELLVGDVERATVG